MYGPNISATQCESLAGPVGVEAVRREPQELPQGVAEPPSSMTTSERLLETLAQGMQQLKKAQLDHLERTDRKREEETPEQCKPGTSTLPALPSPSGNESAVALQDWIEVIDGPLRDISDSSSWWWDSVKQRAQESYKKWVASGPYERLSLKPPTAEDLEKGKYSRLECEDGRYDASLCLELSGLKWWRGPLPDRRLPCCSGCSPCTNREEKARRPTSSSTWSPRRRHRRQQSW